MIYPVPLCNNTTYKVSYDVRVLGNDAENTDVSALVSCNLRYYDKTGNLSGKTDHMVQTTSVKTSDGWVNVSFECTVKNLVTIYTGEFLLVADPAGEHQVVCQVDNLVITKK